LSKTKFPRPRSITKSRTSSNFSFWIERFEGADGETGDELVVDVGLQKEALRLARNVVEAFLKRRAG